jgi:uncharacterized protein
MAAKEILITPQQSITLADFHRFAATIHDKPEDRLPSNTVSLFNNLLGRTGINDVLVDIHCHAFTYKNIPRNFIKYPKWIPDQLVRKAAKLLISKDFGTALDLSQPIKLIDELLRIYHSASGNGLNTVVMGLLMMDMERAISGGVEQGFDGQLSEVKGLVDNYQFSQGQMKVSGNHILPFLAIDPHNKDVLRMFLSAFVEDMLMRYPNIDYGTFQGIKIYPSLGYVPHHPLLMEIFKVCEAKQIPITAHCGGNRTHPSVDKIIVSYRKFHPDGSEEDKTQSFILRGEEGDRFTKYFNRPEHWQKILKRHPDLKLNIAHFGSNDDWKLFLSTDINDRAKSGVQQTINLLQSKNVYADFSYSFYSQAHVNAIFNTLTTHPFLKNKVMYGSDFYMCQIEKGTLLDYYQYVKSVFGRDTEINDNFFVKNAIRFLMK